MKKYKELRLLNKILVDVVDKNELIITRKRYDVETGEETDFHKESFFRETLEKQKKDLQDMIDDVKEMLKEFN